MDLADPCRVLRPADLAQLLGISLATLWRWERDGILPPSRQIGPRVSGFLAIEIAGFLQERPSDRRGTAATVDEVKESEVARKQGAVEGARIGAGRRDSLNRRP